MKAYTMKMKAYTMKVVTMKIPNPVAAIVVAIVVGLAHAPAASDTPDSRWEPEPYIKLDHPDWSRDAVLYQINTRRIPARRAGRRPGACRNAGKDLIKAKRIEPQMNAD